MNTSIEIKKSYELLTEKEQAALRIYALLCTEGVSLRDLCEIIGADPHAFGKEIKSILKTGLLEERLNIVYCPEEVAEFLVGTPQSPEMINTIILKLTENTTLAPTDSMLAKKPFFTMGTNIMKYVLENPEGIAYEAFARLVINLTRHHEIYGKPEPDIHNNSELKLMKAIRLAQGKTAPQSLLYASLLTCEAWLEICGFYYDHSSKLLEEAFAIESMHENNEEGLAFTYLAKAFWHENYGQQADCLALALKANEATSDAALKSYTAAYIAYQLILSEEHQASNMWMPKNDSQTRIPELSTTGIFCRLAEAVKNNSLDELIRCEWLVSQINNEAPIKARIYAARSLLYGKWELTIEANQQYRLYMDLLARHFASTDGALIILTAAEIVRLTNCGALVQAKRLVNEKLDGIDLTNSRYALSVRIEMCLAYTEYYRAAGLHALADTYSILGKEFTQKALPTEKEIPTTASEENMLYLWEYEQLLNMISEKSACATEMHQHIEALKERFPSKALELEVISASFLDNRMAFMAWHSCIARADSNKRYHIAMMSARWAASIGLIWEAQSFYVIARNTEGYKTLNKYQRITADLEIIINKDDCGLRGETETEWAMLEELASGTSLSADVYQAHAYCEYAHDNWKKALNLYKKCISCYRYQPEADIIDQRLISILAYISSCHSCMGNYQAAVDSIVLAKQYIPENDYEFFSLEYNHAYYCTVLNQDTAAREALARAKALARTSEERESVKDLSIVLAMEPKYREACFKK